MTNTQKATIAVTSMICIALALVLMSPAQSPAAESNAAIELENIFVGVAENAQPSVVHLKAERSPLKGLEQLEEEELFKIFPFPHMDPNKLRAQAMGSGVIIDKDGYILTNNHLVEGADEITVRIINSEDDKGREYEGQIVGRDPATDLAVIKINAEEPLHAAKLGDASKLKVGQWAIAIGDPFGLEKTVTVGVISGLGRSDFRGPLGRVRYQNFIQTDASINPGNSGGPLLNIDGEVIGINTFIQAAGSGLGFAIPIDMAQEVYAQLVEHGEVIRGFLGVGIGELDEGMAAALKVPDLRGALVENVVPDSPAEKAGLRHGDVIRKVDDLEVEDPKMLMDVISHMSPGEKVHIALWRKGNEKEFDIELAKFPEQVDVAKKTEKKKNLIGLSVEEVSGEMAAPAGKAVIVTDVRTDSPADEGGLLKGDIILEINMEEVHSVAEFQDIVANLERGQWVSFYIKRGRQTIYKALKIPADEK